MCSPHQEGQITFSDPAAITILFTHTCPSNSVHILSFLGAQHYTSKCAAATNTFKQPAVLLE